MSEITEKAVEILQEMSDESQAMQKCALDLGIIALKKRIPRKVNAVTPKGGRYIDCVVFYRCPTCDCHVEKDYLYCNVCGQRIEFD